MPIRGRHIRRRRPSFVRLVLVAGVVVGVLGFALWPRQLGSDLASPALAADTGRQPSSVLGRSITTTIPAVMPPTTATPSTTVPTTTSTTTRPPRSFSMAFTGDLLIHQGVTAAARSHAGDGRDFDFRPLLEPVRPFIEDADWAVCHLEVNLSADNDGLSGYPRFRAPGQLAADIGDIGYDACSTASNHTMDMGAEGVAETIGVLEDAGLRFTGTARSLEERKLSRIYEIGGVEVHHLSYTYWFNGLALPEDQPWLSQAIERELILDDAAAARAEGAEFVVVSLHWGEQYQHAPNPQQSELGPELLASPDIDLIIGHHAHVVQPIDYIDGEWLVYGLGNLISGDRRTLDELLVTVDVNETADHRFEVGRLTVVPLHLDPANLTVHPAGRFGEDGSMAWGDARDRIIEVLEQGSGWGHFEVAG